jgi:hypothetical protein
MSMSSSQMNFHNTITPPKIPQEFGCNFFDKKEKKKQLH